MADYRTVMVCDSAPALEDAFDALDAAVLPTLSTLLDALIETACLARPGIDGEVHAAQLRILAGSLEKATRQIESLAAVPAAARTGYASAA